MESALDWHSALALLDWQVDLGADEAIGDYLLALAAAGAIVECNNDFYALAVADLSCFETLRAIREEPNVHVHRLQWAEPERWPSQTAVITLTKAMVRNGPKAQEWIRMADALSKLTARPPLAICNWASSLGGGQNAAMEFLVRTGFFCLPRPDGPGF